jgi:hypothetical protein
VDGSAVERAYDDILNTEDAVERMLKVAGVVCSAFAEGGHPLVVVGSSAVAFYTHGSIPCDELHLCRMNPEPICVRDRQRLMGTVDGVGGPSSWQVFGLAVQLHGQVETDTNAEPFARDTDYGTVDIIPPEQLLVENVVVATFPVPNQRAERVALALMKAGVLGGVEFDWNEVSRLVSLPDYNVAVALERLRVELERENMK